MSFWTFLFVPTIIFMVIVAPTWIVMHYRAKDKEGGAISADEQASLDSLLNNLDKLTHRIDTLEEILNEEQPGWKKAQTEEK